MAKLGGDPDIKNSDFGINKFGYNSDVDAAEDIWTGGGNFDWTKVAANAATTIESSSVEDDPDKGGGVPGTGAWTVEVEGLVLETIGQLTGGRIYKETVSLNGAAAVTLSHQFAFVYRVAVKTAGTGNANAGLLSVKHAADVIARVEISDNQTEMALMIVPQFTSQGTVIQGAYLHGWDASVVANTAQNAGIGIFVAGKDTVVFRPQRRGTITVANDIRDEFHAPLYYTPGTKIKVRATSVSAANQAIQGGFTLEYDI